MALLICTGVEQSGWEQIFRGLLSAGGHAIDVNQLSVKPNAESHGIGFISSDKLKYCSEEQLPNATYLAFVSHPAQAVVASSRAKGDNPFSLDACINNWSSQTSLLADSASQSNVVLLSTTDVQNHFSTFINWLNDSYGLSLNDENGLRPCAFNQAALYGAQQALRRHCEADELYLQTLLQTQLMSSIEAIEQADEINFSGFMASFELASSESKHEVTLLEQDKEQLEQEKAKLNDENLQLSSENELALLQICQLQEELEQQFLAIQHSDKEQQKIKQEVEVENELARFQIYQLQEELEHYYIKALELQNQVANWDASQYVNVKHADVMRGAFSQALIIDEHYQEPHYSHLALTLNKVTLGDGRQFEQLKCKLVNNSGCLGLELRAAQNAVNLLSQWPANLSDEFGQRLIFHPTPSVALLSAQNQVEEQMNASDRVAVVGIINGIYELMDSNTFDDNVGLSAEELQGWKLAALALFDATYQLPDWLSFDDVALREEMQSDGYEHLSLVFDKLLFNTKLFQSYEIKVNVTDLPGKQVFANHLAIEFRELRSGNAPLQSWPPESKDEYGYWLRIDVNLNHNQLILDGAELLTSQDKLLVTHLLKNLRPILQRLRDSGKAELKRDWIDWLQLGERLEHLHQRAIAQTMSRRTKNILKRVAAIVR